jgi:hypothetical protein
MTQINTDDYEGHTPGPWEWFLERIIQAEDAVGNEGWVSIAIMDSTEGDYKKEDARLIADAPLLLEEVKRLREQMDSVRDWVREFEDEHMMSIFKIWIGEEE